jgi:dTDP-4-dehydrorhamnose 3,5-epimerase
VKVEKTTLEGCLLLTPSQFKDVRGTFCETYNKQDFKAHTGIAVDFIQDNQSVSCFGVLRGLHFQRGAMAQAKLVRVIEGKVLDIVVDLRKNSDTFGKHYAVILDGENRQQLFVPRDFAHGFVTLSEKSIFAYKCDNYYDKDSESGIIYNDATLSLNWHLSKDDLIISEKDLILPTFEDAIT